MKGEKHYGTVPYLVSSSKKLFYTEFKFLVKMWYSNLRIRIFLKCLIRNRMKWIRISNPDCHVVRFPFLIFVCIVCRCSTQQCNTRCWPTRVWRSWAAFSSSSPPSLSSGTNSSARKHQQVALIFFNCKIVTFARNGVTNWKTFWTNVFQTVIWHLFAGESH